MSLHDDPDIAEQLSALMDGELDAERARFLLRRLGGDVQLRDAWERLHLVRACLAERPGEWAPAGFAESVARRLDAERIPARPGRSPGVLRWTGGAALAASVALMALLVVAPNTPVPVGEHVAGAEAVATSADARVAPSALRESDLRPNVMAQTASVARRFDGSGQALQVHTGGPIYVPAYLVEPNGRETEVTLKRDREGGWVLLHGDDAAPTHVEPRR